MGEDIIKKRFDLLSFALDERLRRLVAAAEASVLGYGGVSKVSRATGVSRRAIIEGRKELQEGIAPQIHRHIRKKGAGRKRLTEKNPQLIKALEALVEPTTRGDPETPLRWTCKSVRRLAKEVTKEGHKASHTVVAELLHKLGYSLQSNSKIREGASQHPDRNAQFEHINKRVHTFQRRHQPVISVDTKKKELVGDFKNGGQEWSRKGKPVPVQVHDFGKRVAPYGVFDITENVGWVNVGVDHDTASFAVESIRRWWNSMGKLSYPKASELLITCDGGGSNGSRVRLWKVELQNFADETGLKISVCHFPPGTSKWNKIEHRLFSFITQNWRGKPLTTHEVIVNLIAGTTNSKGLTVKCELDTNVYPKGRKITDKQMATLRIQRHQFHGEWNYSLSPRNF